MARFSFFIFYECLFHRSTQLRFPNCVEWIFYRWRRQWNIKCKRYGRDIRLVCFSSPIFAEKIVIRWLWVCQWSLRWSAMTSGRLRRHAYMKSRTRGWIVKKKNREDKRTSARRQVVKRRRNKKKREKFSGKIRNSNSNSKKPSSE